MTNDNNQQDNKQFKQFEDLFQEENYLKEQEKEEKEFRRSMFTKHLLAVGAYVIGMFLLPVIIILIIGSIPSSTVSVQPEELVIESVATDGDAISFINQTSYNQYKKLYEKYLLKYDYEGYYLVINIYNQDIFKETGFIDDDGVVDEIVLQKYLNGELTEWSNKRVINLYATSSTGGAHPDFILDFDLLKHKIFNEAELRYSSGALNVANFVTYLILIGVIGFLLFPNLKRDFIPIKQRDRQLIIGMFTGVAIVFGASAVATIIQSLLSLVLKMPGGESLNQISIELALRGSGAPLMIISAVILGPIVEELIFRKATFELVRNKWAAAAVSTVLFALIHVSSELSNIANFGHFIYVFLPYLTMGAAFAAVYIIFKQNIYTVIGAHMLWNLLAIIVSYSSFAG